MSYQQVGQRSLPLDRSPMMPMPMSTKHGINSPADTATVSRVSLKPPCHAYQRRTSNAPQIETALSRNSTQPSSTRDQETR